MSPAWSARDYLLRNAFCPIPEIQEFVDGIRASIGTPWLMVVPFDHRDRLMSLFFVASIVEQEAADVRSRARITDWRSATSAVDQTASEIEAFAELLLDSREPQRLSARRTAQPATHDDDGAPSVARWYPDPVGFIGFWLVAPDGLAQRIPHNDVDRLLEMINGTVFANSNRDGRISDLVASPSKDADNPRSAQSLLRLAVSVTAARTAAFYLADPREKRLRRINALPLDGVPDLAFPEFISLKRYRVDEPHLDQVRRAYYRSRTLAWPPPGAVRDTGQADWAIAAVPIPRAPLSAQNIGILAVAMRGTHAHGQLGQSDLALLRNVALRLSLFHNLDVTAKSAELLVDFGKTFTEQLSATSSELDVLDRSGATVSADIERARPQLERLAHHAWQETGCDSVTLRILTPSFVQKDSGRWMLRRFLAYPVERMNLGFADIPIDGTANRSRQTDDERWEAWQVSANAWAAVKGASAYIWDAHGPLDAQVPGLQRIERTTPSVRSELTLPIYADGMLIGTMNLESSIPDFFGAQLESIATFATLAGIAVSMGRREAIRSIAERFSLLGRGYHEASSVPTVIERVREQLSEAGQADVDDLLAPIEEMVLAARTPLAEPVDESAPGRSLYDLIDDAARRESTVAEALDLRVHPDTAVDAAHATVLDAAFKEIFRNVHQSTSTSVHVVERELRLAGQSYRVLTVSNDGASGAVTPWSLQRLYRRPLPDKTARGRPHLGCFTVGEMLRGIGGNAFAGRSAGLFHTHLILPKGHHAAD